MSQFATNLLVQNDDRLLRQSSQSDLSAYRETPYEFPYGNIILNLFNNEVPSIPQDFPLNPTTSNYQLNYPSESVNQFGGLGINLFNALSSISRYDDLKCVPRILCEVASGKPPGRYKQASMGNDKQHYLEEFGRSTFAQWLAGSAEASPMLNFARAVVLGYSSNGNPAMCYRAFPRCPRNPDKLVHYLNNHNGGFFRFFSRGEHSLPQSSYVSRGRKALPPGIVGAEADRTGTGKLNLDIISTAQDYGKNFFSKDNTLEGSGQVVFLNEESLKDGNDHRSSGNRFSEFLTDLQSSNMFSQDPIPFFPQESKEQGVRILRFTPEVSDSTSHGTFRFPH
ncbi:uncharacterized protein LOC112639777 [Camponotus floridanus]|nr:uncharacterized protein LOC112639777 [Camponotus floridanus]